MWFPVVVMVLLAFTLVGGGIWFTLQQNQERRAIWRALADRRGGRYTDVSWEFLRRSSEAVEVTIAHAIVRLDLYVVSNGKSSTTYTRVRARYALGAGPSFSVYEEGLLSSIGKALGTQDLELGDPSFDQTFMVKASGLEAVRATWTPRARAILTDQLREIRADADGTEVKLVAVGARRDPQVLDAMLELAGELASVGARELVALEEDIDEAVLVPVEGTWDRPIAPHLRIATDSSEVTAFATPAGTTPGLELALTAESALPSFEVRVSGGAADGLPRGILTDTARALLRAADGATLSASEREVKISWPRIPSAAAVASSARLLAELATGSRSVGAFR